MVVGIANELTSRGIGVPIILLILLRTVRNMSHSESLRHFFFHSIIFRRDFPEEVSVYEVPKAQTRRTVQYPDLSPGVVPVFCHRL